MNTTTFPHEMIFPKGREKYIFRWTDEGRDTIELALSKLASSELSFNLEDAAVCTAMIKSREKS